jgi:hypothetical protein
MVMMSNTVVDEEHLSENPVEPPTTASYPNDEHYEHLRRVANLCGFKPVDYVLEGSRRWRKAHKKEEA